MNKFLKLFGNYIFPIILTSIVLFLCFRNYTPGTILSGWDTLHPEFDFKLAFERAVFGVWRGEQGLGAIAGHSHMSDLPRIIFLWASSFFLNVNFLRYFYVFLTLLIGPLGMYFLVRYLFRKDGLVANISSFLASFYYLFNLGTVQNYFVPFEMFTTLYAFIPWIYLLTFKFINDGRRKDFILFGIVSIFSAPMAYAASLFYSYLVGLVLFMSVFVLLSSEKRKVIKRVLLIIAGIIVTNFYWLLPNAYSIIKQSGQIADANINRLFSQEAFLSNKAYGDINNVAVFKNHLFSWKKYDFEEGKFVELMGVWNSHVNRPQVKYALYTISFFAFAGLVLTIFKRDKFGLALTPVLLLSLFFIINENPPFTEIFSLLKSKVGLFQEAFRMPYTKFAIPMMFSLAYYFGYLVNFLASLTLKWKVARVLLITMLFGFSFVFIYTSKPMFEGQLISAQMRVNIPDEYFQLADFMKGKDDGIVAKFPMPSLYGWNYYDWGYEGGGPSFMTFLLKQPTLDRDFDRWSAYNETFYNQISSALYSQDSDVFVGLLNKYSIRYLLLDESIINPSSDEESLYNNEFKNIVQHSSKIKMLGRFGFLTVYEVSYPSADNKISAPIRLASVSANTLYSKQDPVFKKYGYYVDSNTNYLPFVNFDDRTDVQISKDNETIKVSNSISSNDDSEHILNVPGLSVINSAIPVDVFVRTENDGMFYLTLKVPMPEVFVGNEKVYSNEDLFQSHYYKFPRDINPAYVSVGDSVFEIGDINGSNKYIGSTSVTKANVAVRVFGSKSETRRDAVDVFLNSSPRFCSDPEKTVGLDRDGEMYSITVGKDSVCWGNGLTLSESSLVKISYESKSSDNLYPRICISETGRDGCINSNLPSKIEKIGDWNRLTYDLSLNTGSYWMVFVAQGQEEGRFGISYRNLSINTFGLIDEKDYPIFNTFAGISVAKKIPLQIPLKSEIEVRIPIRNQVEENYSLVRGHSKALNCDSVKLGSVEKISKNDGIYYSASSGGTSCDYLDYLNLDQSSGYLLNVASDNILGRGLKYYIQDYESGYIDQERLLPQNSKYEDSVVILPKKTNSFGYVLNYETRAFGKVDSENFLYKVSFVPLPVDWLNSISISKSGQIEVPLNTITVKESYEITPSSYYLTLNNLALKVGYFELKQSYEDGWLAFRIPDSKSSIKNKLSVWFPFLFGQKLEHVKINGWANGWIIEPSSDEHFDNSNVIIFYWPQYLEYLGFGILITGTLYLFIYGKFVNAKRQSNLFDKVLN